MTEVERIKEKFPIGAYVQVTAFMDDIKHGRIASHNALCQRPIVMLGIQDAPGSPLYWFYPNELSVTCAHGGRRCLGR